MQSCTLQAMATGDLHIVSKPSLVENTGKPPVIFVHGAWHGAWCWEAHFLGYFAERGFDCHALDLRGHGKSPAVKSMRWNRIADYTDDVLSVVGSLDRDPILIGHSMGGFISQHCMRQSGRLAAVGLLATVPHYGALPVSLKVGLRRPLDFAAVNLTWSLYPLVRNPGKAKHMFLEEDVSEADTRAFAGRLVDESYWGYLDMVGLDLPGRYDGRLPVLVVGGEKDTLFPPSSQQATARRYGGACHIVENAPHDLMLASQWRETADQFINWIDGLAPDSIPS